MSRAFGNYIGKPEPKCPFCRATICNAEALLNQFTTREQRGECAICSETECEMIAFPCEHEICCECFIRLVRVSPEAHAPIPLSLPDPTRPRSAPASSVRTAGPIRHLGRTPPWEQRRMSDERRQELRRRESGWRV